MDLDQVRSKVFRARGTALTCVAVLGIIGLYALRYGTLPTGRPADEAVAESVRTVIAATLAANPCNHPDQATRAMQSALHAAGYDDWRVRSGSAVEPGSCVTATIRSETREVVLIPALRPEVRSMMVTITEELYSRCLGREAAIGVVVDTLRSVGEVDFEIRTDGPVTAPVDRREAVFAHVAAGCWVFAGTGWTDEGTRLYYVSGVGSE